MTTNTTPSTASQAPEVLTRQVAAWRAEVARLNDLIAHATGASQEPEVSIDTPEFRELLKKYHRSTTWDTKLIDHIDAKLAREREEAPKAMLDMLGWYHPYERPEHGNEFKAMTDRFLDYATDFQQPLPVPDQAAIVWRAHLLQWRFELAHLRAVKESYSRVHDRAVKAEAALSAIRQGVECNAATLECLGDIFSNTERPDKITVRIDNVTNSLHVHYEDLDEEWLREVKEALATPPKADESGLPG